MGTMPTDFSSLQPSDYGSYLIGLQDYPQVPVPDILAAPAYDSSLGVDPLTGADITPIPWAPVDPANLTAQPWDASFGLNAVNPTLLPYLDPSNPTGGMIDPSLLGTFTASTGIVGTGGSPSSGPWLATDANLPLTTPDKFNMTSLLKPIASATALGASIWQSIVGGSGAPVTIGGAKAGTAGTPNASSVPGAVKPAPPTAIGNPISNTTMFLVLGVVSALIGAILWSFSGAK